MTCSPTMSCRRASTSKPWHGFLDMFKGPINAEVNDLVINSDGEIAYSHSVQHVSGTLYLMFNEVPTFMKKSSLASRRADATIRAGLPDLF